MVQLIFNDSFDDLIEEPISYWKTSDDIPQNIKDFIIETSDLISIFDENNNKYYCPKCTKELTKQNTCPECSRKFTLNKKLNIYNIKEIRNFRNYIYYYVFDIIDDNVSLYLLREYVNYDNPLTYYPYKMSEISIDAIYQILPTEVIDFKNNKHFSYKKLEEIPEEIVDEFEKVISLNVIDKYWMEQINTMSHLREGISLRQYAQDNPLRAYTEEGFELFDKMLQNIDKNITLYLLRAEVRQNIERKEVVKNKVTNDNDTTKAITTKTKKQKIGRNDPCPCGSGKKYKQCCGK